MNELTTSNSAASQRALILAWLRANSLTTQQARTKLDIFHPAARVQELREQGYNIITRWETVTNHNKKHRIAKYVLFSGGTHA